MEAPHRTCPGCESALVPHVAREVHFDRCEFCGGVWIDAHGLAALASERPGEAGSEASHCCPDCGYLLRYTMAGDLLVERCAQCGGIYLAADAVQQLVADLRPRRRSLRAPPAGEDSFRCPACGERFPRELGVTTPRGLACGACYGAVAHAASPAPPTGRMPAPDVPYGLPAAADTAADLAGAAPGPAGFAVAAVLSLVDLLSGERD